MSKWEKGSFSIFFGCFPVTVSKRWFYDLFGHCGEVTDVFILRKARHESQSPYVFVKFRLKEKDFRVIHDFNGMFIHDHHFVVSKVLVRKHLGDARYIKRDAKLL